MKIGLLNSLAVLLLASFVGLSATMLEEMRRETWTLQTRAARNLIIAEADDIGRTLTIYELSLRSTARLIPEVQKADVSPRLRQLALFDQGTSAAYFGSIRVIDADGRVVQDSANLSPPPPTRAEVDALRIHRDSTVTGMLISKPFGSGPHAFGMIGLSLRIPTTDGHFAGIISGSIQLAYFAELFQRLELGPHDVVSLVRGDGVMLAHAPSRVLPGQTIAASEALRQFALRSHGSFVAESAVDHVRRVYTFAHVDPWPIVLDVGLSEADLYAGWRHKAFSVGLLLTAITTAGAGLLLTLRRQLKRRIEAEARYRLFADHTSDVIHCYDGGLARVFVSPSCSQYGYTPEDLIGAHPKTLVHPEDWPTVQAMIADAQRTRGNLEAVYRILRRDGSPVWVEAHYNYVPGDGGFIVIARDITARKTAEQALEQANEELRRQATTDGLTGLANRRHFDECLDLEWRRARRSHVALSLLAIDVDWFKPYNDQYGHQAGDAVLQKIAEVIQIGIRRPGDLAARYGGEEFVVILPETDIYGAIDVAEEIRRTVGSLALPHESSPRGIVSVSIGVCTMPPNATIVETSSLFAAADEALYRAKRSGRDQVQARTIQSQPADGA